MKNLSKYSYLILIFTIMICNSALAQNFTGVSGSVTETVFGVATVNVRSTGNDVHDDVANSDTYRVSVWDDLNSSSGLYWDVLYNTTQYNGTASFAYNVIDPDVVIVKEGSTIYALAVYKV